MFPVKGKAVRIERFEKIAPTQVLYDFNGPKIFTTEDADGEMLIAYQADEDDAIGRYVLAPFSEEGLKLLELGATTVREALAQTWVWLADADMSDWSVSSAWRTSLEDIPARHLPDADVMLWPSLEPIFVVRAVGPDAQKGFIKPKIIQQLIGGAESALKQLTSYVKDQLHVADIGLSELGDVRAQHFAFKSFEVGFRAARKASPTAAPGQLIADVLSPEGEAVALPAGPLTDAMKQVGDLLTRGLAWATDPEKDFNAKIAFSNNAERTAVLEALTSLTALTAQSGVTRLEIGGSFVKARGDSQADGKVILTSQTRERIQFVLRPSAKPKKMTLTGSLAVSDKDKYVFVLRRIEQAEGERRCKYPKPLHRTVMDAFHDDVRVKITGVQKPRIFSVESITPVGPSKRKK